MGRKITNMKYTLFLLFIPFLAQAQIDLSRVTLTSDSTLTVRDTSFWQLHEADIQVGNRTITLYQADLIQIQGGQKRIPKTIGPMMRRDFIEAIRSERDRYNQEIQTLQAAAKGLADRRNELNGILR
jgi:hypothetical protein